MASGYRLTKVEPKSHPIVSRFNRNELEEWKELLFSPPRTLLGGGNVIQFCAQLVL
jgi:hypothetical protein